MYKAETTQHSVLTVEPSSVKFQSVKTQCIPNLAIHSLLVAFFPAPKLIFNFLGVYLSVGWLLVGAKKASRRKKWFFGLR